MNIETQPTTRGGVSEFDPVSLALLTARFEGIVRKISNTLFRTARSAVLNTARDFSCCIVTRDDQLLVAVDSLPVHVLSGPDLTSRWMKEFHPILHRGDAYLHNSPYHGNSHAADQCIVVPVVDESGVHHFTVVTKAHVADCGNSVPSTMWATCRDVYEEGALIFPCVKVQQDYEDIDDIVRMCHARIRVPEMWHGDYLAMVGAARIGEREILALGDERGWDQLHAYTEAWLDYSEQQMITALRELPGGRIVVENRLDPVPVEGADEGVPVRIEVSVDPADAMVEVDLRDNPDCLPFGMNLTEATVTSAAAIGLFNSLRTVVPQNGGSGRRLAVLLREGCVVGIPTHPASCSAATFALAERVASGVQRAIAELGEGFGMAECGGECPASGVVILGHDPRREGAPFVNQLLLGFTGGAAHARGDGWVTSGTVGAAGVMLRDSVEVDELLYPVRIWSDRLIVDSGGPGRYRGSPGAYVEYGVVDTKLEGMWTSDGCVNAAQGARGGYPGANSGQFLRRRDGSLEPLSQWGHVFLEPGETVISLSTGGGGYGPPYERDVDRVRRDVAEGWVSAAQAEAVYGVVINGRGAVDVEKTAAQRRHLAEADQATPTRLDMDDVTERLIEQGARLVREERSEG
jgi:N-methylhydantoinase B